MADTRQWAKDLLKGLGVPMSTGAIQALVGWQRAEGGHTNNQAKWNFLNTTQEMPGAGNTGSQGNIKVYQNYQQGIDATVKTLQNGRYTGILAALAKGDPQGVASAIDQSPWGTHGNLLYQTVTGHSTPANIGNVGGTAGKIASDTASAAMRRAAGYAPQMNAFSTIASMTPVAGVATSPSAQKLAQTTQQNWGLMGQIQDAINNARSNIQSNVASTTSTSPTVPDGGATNPGNLPSGVGKFEGAPVAAWIAPILEYARSQGWKGSVNSGFRSLEDQTRIYNSGVRPAAKPGTSNHEGADFPRGAVDVSEAAQLSDILRKSKYKSLLVWAGGKDPVHFSHPHNGSY